MNDLDTALTLEPGLCAPGTPIVFRSPNESAGHYETHGHFVAWTRNQQGQPLAIVRNAAGYVSAVGLEALQFLTQSDSLGALEALVSIGIRCRAYEAEKVMDASMARRRLVQDYINTLRTMDSDSAGPQEELERLALVGRRESQAEAWAAGYDFAIKTVQQFTQAHEISK